MEYGRRISVLAFLLFITFTTAAQSEEDNSVPYKELKEHIPAECRGLHKMKDIDVPLLLSIVINNFLDMCSLGATKIEAMNHYLQINAEEEAFFKNFRQKIDKKNSSKPYLDSNPIYYAVENVAYEVSQEDLDYMTDKDKAEYKLFSAECWINACLTDAAGLIGPFDYIRRKEEADSSYIIFELKKIDEYRKGDSIYLIDNEIKYRVNNIVVYSSLVDLMRGHISFHHIPMTAYNMDTDYISKVNITDGYKKS